LAVFFRLAQVHHFKQLSLHQATTPLLQTPYKTGNTCIATHLKSSITIRAAHKPNANNFSGDPEHA
jgi:hypothetical protein